MNFSGVWKARGGVCLWSTALTGDECGAVGSAGSGRLFTTGFGCLGPASEPCEDSRELSGAFAVVCLTRSAALAGFSRLS